MIEAAGAAPRPRGVQDLTFQDEKDGQRRRKSDPDSQTPEERPARTGKRRPPAAEFGQALKTVYQRTIDEEIPPEMLDLLGKLG